jgi:hypothetical protein
LIFYLAFFIVHLLFNLLKNNRFFPPCAGRALAVRRFKIPLVFRPFRRRPGIVFLFHFAKIKRVFVRVFIFKKANKARAAA